MPVPARITWISIAAVILGGAVYYYMFVLAPQRVPDRQQVLRIIADAQRAVEQKRVSELMRHISEDYEDGHGFNRRMIQRLALSAARSREAINLSVEVPHVEVVGDRATFVAEVSYAMGDQPVGRRDARRLTVTGELRRERGTWRIISADGWQSAERL